MSNPSKPPEVFTYEDLRLIANAVRRYRQHGERRARAACREPTAVAQLDRIERIVARLAKAKKP